MSKYVITLSRSEIETAVRNYVSREVTISGRRELKDPTIRFSGNDGDLQYFEAYIEVEEKSSDGQ